MWYDVEQRDLEFFGIQVIIDIMGEDKRYIGCILGNVYRMKIDMYIEWK